MLQHTKKSESLYKQLCASKFGVEPHIDEMVRCPGAQAFGHKYIFTLELCVCYVLYTFSITKLKYN